MSSKNRTSLVAGPDDWFRELTIPGAVATETELWNAPLWTPMKANGRYPRLWRLMAGGESFARNGSGTTLLNVYAGDKTTGLLIGSVTLPASADGGDDWWVNANIYNYTVGTDPSSADPPTRINMIGTFIQVGENIPYVFAGNKQNFNPFTDTFLTVTATVPGHDHDDVPVEVNFVGLEALN